MSRAPQTHAIRWARGESRSETSRKASLRGRSTAEAVENEKLLLPSLLPLLLHSVTPSATAPVWAGIWGKPCGSWGACGPLGSHTASLTALLIQHAARRSTSTFDKQFLSSKYVSVVTGDLCSVPSRTFGIQI